ncbi:enkurin-like [Cloeon dipterum]|uniref:enkurin-like n=1 Tax=Cloeon dipterum TaxID=197152 RepID=UPI00321F8E78
MSIEFSEENIEDIIERPLPKIIKLKRHKSAHHDRIKKENEVLKKSRSTMGNAEEPLPEPNNFLKKHTRKELKKETDEPKCWLSSCKPQLPSPASIRRKDEKNFLADNIKCAASSKSKYPEPKVVDSHKGNTTPLRRPSYIYKQSFGRAPAHIYRLKSAANQQETSSCEQKMKMMSQGERSKLVEGLEKSLKDRNSEFLLLPVIIDTPYLINKKKKLESEIKQIESDLQMISSNFDIYITDD